MWSIWIPNAKNTKHHDKETQNPNTQENAMLGNFFTTSKIGKS